MNGHHKGLESLKCGRQKFGPGDTAWELDHDQVLWQTAGGSLFLCTCVEWKWSCDNIAGSTYCYKECVNFKCKPVPAR